MSLLEIRGLRKSYGGDFALDGIDLTVEKSRIVGLLGPNGSGKTTLIKLINGLLTPSAGSITVGGFAPSPQSKALVSYLPERNALSLWMTAEQAIAYYADFFADFRREKAYAMLKELGINPRMTLKAMSKGTREKVQLILVMSREAKLYILDEPIGGVDPATRDYILRTIIGNYSEDASVIIATHLIADVEPILDDVIFLQNGKIALADSADRIRSEKGTSIDALFREVFKC